MCSPVRCRTCGKTTWSGCGEHADQVMAKVPMDQRCTCSAKGTGASAPASAPGKPRKGLGRFFGR